MPGRLLLAALVVAGALLAGCSDDDGGGGSGDLSDEEQEFVDGAMEGFDAEEAAPLTEDDAECIATSMVQEVGVDELEAVGITAESFASEDDFPSGLSTEQATSVVEAIGGCVDLRAVFLDGFTEDESLSPDAEACLEREFSADLVDRVMVVMLSEGEAALDESSELTAELLGIFDACPEALGG